MTYEKPLWLQDAAVSYAAQDDRRLITALWSEGVISGLRVSQRGAGANLSVDVAVGRAVVTGDDNTGQGNYLCEVSGSAANLAIGSPPATARIDLVVLSVRDPQQGGPAGKDIVLAVVAGTPSGSPSPPATPTSSIVLAQVRVNNGASSIVDANITDVRPVALMPGELPGVPVPWFGSSAPAGWQLCNGSALDITGAGWRVWRLTGLTSTPDLRGRFIAGQDTMGLSAAGRITGATAVGAGGGSNRIASGAVPYHEHFIGHRHGPFYSEHSGADLHGDAAQNHAGLAWSTQGEAFAVQTVGGGSQGFSLTSGSNQITSGAQAPSQTQTGWTTVAHHHGPMYTEDNADGTNNGGPGSSTFKTRHQTTTAGDLTSESDPPITADGNIPPYLAALWILQL